jgi:hypothetical protein
MYFTRAMLHALTFPLFFALVTLITLITMAARWKT